MRYLLDFETRSGLDLRQVGTRKYLNDKQADIVCLSWKQGSDKTRLWLPPATPPFEIKKNDTIYAFNALFDWQVWHTLGIKKYNFPDWPLDQTVDVMAIAGRYTFPQGLDFLGKVLNLPVQKSRRGKALMKKICVPPFKYTRAEFVEFCGYCITDTDTMFEALKVMPSAKLTPLEQRIWLATAKINLRGVPIDLRAVRKINSVIDSFKEMEQAKLADLTGGFVKTVGQTAAIRQALEAYDVFIPDLRAETVREFLEYDMPDEARAILNIRQQLSQSSTAKYKKLLALTYKGRIYENLRYHGASPGRWAGMGFQIHNLPRAKVDDPDAEIQKFMDNSIFKENPMDSAKALIRPCIKAPRNRLLCVADYKSIENVILLWVAGQMDKLDTIRNGLDQYIDFAADLYGISYDDVDSDQRFFGKVVVLGAGYNLGGPGLLKYAEGYGLALEAPKANAAIQAYRDTHPKVKGFWYAVKDAAINSILYKGKKYTHNNCTFQVRPDNHGREWLCLTLPSKRTLFYPEPELREDLFGIVPTHMGINSYARKWQRLKLIPGRITENIVQALARDVLAEGKLRCMDNGFDVIASVHDEIISEVDEGCERSHTLKTMIDLMCKHPTWATDLPLDAEGYIGKRYRKE